MNKRGAAAATCSGEADADRAQRLAYERTLIDEALADVAAGRVISGADVDDMLDRFGRGEPFFFPGDEPPTSGTL